MLFLNCKDKLVWNLTNTSTHRDMWTTYIEYMRNITGGGWWRSSFDNWNEQPKFKSIVNLAI